MSDDNDKLNWLADWFAANDSPGEADEAQQDLRRIAARIAELEKALREIRDSPYCDYESQPATSYGTGVVDGHRYCSTIARKALETDE